MQKRAISPLIATILLIGMSIVLAVSIFGFTQGWFSGLIKTTGEKSLTDADLLNRIQMNVDVQAEGNKIKGTIANIGQIDFESVKLNIIGSEGTETIELSGIEKGNVLTIPEQTPNVGNIQKIIIVPGISHNGQIIMASSVAFEQTPDYYPISCLAILQNGKSNGDGTYQIDPDGPEGNAPFNVYCDMTTDGRGWTLILKTKEDTNTFHYNSGYWTTANMFQEGDISLNANDAKYNSFNEVSFTFLRGCVGSATTNCLIHNFGSTKNSALNLFSEPEGPTCTKFNNGGTLTFIDFENIFGFNLYDGPCIGGPVFNKPDAGCGGGDSKVRWGIYTDEDVNCGSPNEAMGWGLTDDGSAPGSAGSGGYTPRMTHQGKNTWLWVR